MGEYSRCGITYRMLTMAYSGETKNQNHPSISHSYNGSWDNSAIKRSAGGIKIYGPRYRRRSFSDRKLRRSEIKKLRCNPGRYGLRFDAHRHCPKRNTWGTSIWRFRSLSPTRDEFCSIAAIHRWLKQCDWDPRCTHPPFRDNISKLLPKTTKWDVSANGPPPGRFPPGPLDRGAPATFADGVGSRDVK